MNRITLLVVSLSLVVLLSAPVTLAGEAVGGYAPPSPGGGGPIVLPGKADWLPLQVWLLVLNLERTMPLL